MPSSSDQQRYTRLAQITKLNSRSQKCKPVPRTRLPEVLARITEIGKEYGLNIANVFHAGDGNLHPNILFDRQNQDELERVERASREIMTLCVSVGGTITGEHGVGIDKRGYMPLVYNEVELEMLRRARWVFDPGGNLNPGKVVQ